MGNTDQWNIYLVISLKLLEKSWFGINIKEVKELYRKLSGIVVRNRYSQISLNIKIKYESHKVWT